MQPPRLKKAYDVIIHAASRTPCPAKTVSKMPNSLFSLPPKDVHETLAVGKSALRLHLHLLIASPEG